MAGDAAELCTRMIVTANGGDKTDEEVAGTAVGIGSYAGIGALAGGPVGAAAGAGVYVASRAIGCVIGGVISLFKDWITSLLYSR